VVDEVAGGLLGHQRPGGQVGQPGPVAVDPRGDAALRGREVAEAGLRHRREDAGLHGAVRVEAQQAQVLVLGHGTP
jgi:hypothetical protein